MANKFHINKHGVPAPCKAREGNCPLGGSDQHFDNKEEAQVYADKVNEEKYGILNVSGAISNNFEKQELYDSKDKLVDVSYENGTKNFKGVVTSVYDHPDKPGLIIKSDDGEFKHIKFNRITGFESSLAFEEQELYDSRNRIVDVSYKNGAKNFKGVVTSVYDHPDKPGLIIKDKDGNFKHIKFNRITGFKSAEPTLSGLSSEEFNDKSKSERLSHIVSQLGSRTASREISEWMEEEHLQKFNKEMMKAYNIELSSKPGIHEDGYTNFNQISRALGSKKAIMELAKHADADEFNVVLEKVNSNTSTRKAFKTPAQLRRVWTRKDANEIDSSQINSHLMPVTHRVEKVADIAKNKSDYVYEPDIMTDELMHQLDDDKFEAVLKEVRIKTGLSSYGSSRKEKIGYVINNLSNTQDVIDIIKNRSSEQEMHGYLDKIEDKLSN